MRASLDVSFGRTNSLGGFDVLAGSGLTVETAGSGVGSFGLGFERVARAIIDIVFRLRCCVVCEIYDMHFIMQMYAMSCAGLFGCFN